MKRDELEAIREHDDEDFTRPWGELVNEGWINEARDDRRAILRHVDRLLAVVAAATEWLAAEDAYDPVVDIRGMDAEKARDAFRAARQSLDPPPDRCVHGVPFEHPTEFCEICMRAALRGE